MRQRCIPWLGLLLVGCGRIGFFGGPPAPPASQERHEQLGPFGPPLKHALSSDTLQEETPYVRPDGLEMFFRVDTSADQTVVVATRQDPSAPWGAASPVSSIDTMAFEGSPRLTRDGLSLFFARSFQPNDNDLMVTTRSDLANAFGAPVPIGEINTPGLESCPSPSDDGLAMAFCSNAGGTARNIYTTERPSANAAWGTPEPVDELNSASHDTSNYFGVPGRTVLLFASERSGNFDLYIAFRDPESGRFRPALPLAELNTAARETDAWISDDLRHIIFSSNRDGTLDLFEARR